MSLTPAQIGPYCQPVDVLAVLNPLNTAAAPGSPAALPATVIADLIADAQATVDTWLAERYVVPFGIGNVPDIVFRITRDLSAYLCTLASYGGEPLPANHPALLRYQQAMGTLAALAGGRITLGRPATDTATSGAQPVQPAAAVVNQYTGSMFTLEGAGIVQAPGANRTLPF